MRNVKKTKQFNKNCLLWKKNRGITLVALVITVVVMLILSTITISLVFGEDGIIGAAKTASQKAEEAVIREQIETMIGTYEILKYQNDNEMTLAQYLEDHGCIIKSDTDNQLVVQYKGYEITIDKKTYIIIDIFKIGGIIPEVNIHVTNVNGTELSESDTQAILTVEIVNVSSYGKNYKIEVKSLSGEVLKKESTVVTGVNGQESYKITTKGTYTIVVTGKAADGISKTTEKKQIINLPLATTTTEFSRQYGVIEIVWINENNEVISSPEKPVLLGTNMTPVKWTGEPDSYKEMPADGDNNNNDWYEYIEQKGDTETIGTSRWANAKSKKGSIEAYFVWIPSFSYRIVYFDTELHENEYRKNSKNAEGIIGYSNIDGIVNLELVPGEERLIENSKPINVTGKVKTAGYEDYIPHPAFTFQTEEGQEKTGIWVGKYETSGSSIQPTIIPNKSSLTNKSISYFYKVAFDLKDIYILSGDSHLMKNTEWGAVAYLAESKYGRNGTEVTINNNSSYITGIAGDTVSEATSTSTTNKYDTKKGILASTTANIYGIYDMSGGAYEYVMGALKDETNEDQPLIDSSGFTAEILTNKKYYNLYNRSSSPETYVSNYLMNKGIKGDATYETSTDGANAKSWNSDYSNFIIPNYSWFQRGGSCDSKLNAGIFSFHSFTGGVARYIGFRVVCVK